jgi:hypothetical protein
VLKRKILATCYALIVAVGTNMAGAWYRKLYAYPIFSQHTPNLRNWHPSPPNPPHFAANLPSTHQFSTSFSPILGLNPIEGPPLPQRAQQIR